MQRSASAHGWDPKKLFADRSKLLVSEVVEVMTLAAKPFLALEAFYVDLMKLYNIFCPPQKKAPRRFGQEKQST